MVRIKETASDAWYFEVSDGNICLVAGSESRPVREVVPAEEEQGRVQIETEDSLTTYRLERFKWKKNPISKKFMPLLSSRSSFVKLFQCLKSKHLNDQQNKRQEKDDSDDENQQTPDETNLEDPGDEDETSINDTTSLENRRYLSDKKIVGDAVKVHISNLIEPVRSRLVRSIDESHVEVLKEELRQVGSSFCVVVGVCFTLDGHSIKELEKPCDMKVEVIGGNHTRAALQDLVKEGELSKETISVKLYRDLSNTECLEIGFFHNKSLEKSRTMTFIEICKLMRKKLTSSSKRRAAKKELAQILGCKTVTKMNQNYKIHLRLAATCADTFSLAERAEIKAANGELLGVKKSSLKQTIFSRLFGKNVTEEKRVEVLNALIDEGKSKYMELLRETVQVNEENGGTEEDIVVEDRDMEVDEMIASEENYDLLKRQNEEIKKENERLIELVKDLEEKNKSLQVKLEEYQIVQEPATEKKALEEKQIQKVSFSAGERVMATYSGNKIQYEAEILDVLSNGKFRVKYLLDDLVEERNKRHLNKIKETKKIDTNLNT